MPVSEGSRPDGVVEGEGVHRAQVGADARAEAGQLHLLGLEDCRQLAVAIHLAWLLSILQASNMLMRMRL